MFAWFSTYFLTNLFGERAFAHPVILFWKNFLQNSMDGISVICKLAVEWYLMRMCTSWLCPFNVPRGEAKKSFIWCQFMTFTSESPQGVLMTSYPWHATRSPPMENVFEFGDITIQYVQFHPTWTNTKSSLKGECHQYLVRLENPMEVLVLIGNPLAVA